MNNLRSSAPRNWRRSAVLLSATVGLALVVLAGCSYFTELTCRTADDQGCADNGTQAFGPTATGGDAPGTIGGNSGHGATSSSSSSSSSTGDSGDGGEGGHGDAY